MRPLGHFAAAAALALCVAGGVSACKRPAEPLAPAEVLARAGELLDQGAPESALALLGEHGLGDTPEGQLLAIEAAILQGDFDTAFAALGPVAELSEERRVVLEDACVMGALEALDEVEGRAPERSLARARLEHCAHSERIDIVALRLRLAEDAPTSEVANALIGRLRESGEGPEVDVAAAQLELGLVEHSERAPEASAQAAHLLRLAFTVAQNSELGEAVQQAYFDAASALVEPDPHAAVTLFEYVYLPRVEGLELNAELSERAQAAAHDALLPVYLVNTGARYDRKFLEDDVEAGVFDAETRTFTFDVSTDAAYEAFIEWYFDRLERPRPRPTPDPLAWAEICVDRSQACVFPYERLARWGYEQRNMEARYLQEHGLDAFDWGQP